MAMTLEERYKGKPKLLKFYKEKLLEPGWAGELDDVELAYIKSRLKKSGWLRHRWGSVTKEFLSATSGRWQEMACNAFRAHFQLHFSQERKPPIGNL
jgi:hypothetical protein